MKVLFNFLVTSILIGAYAQFFNYYGYNNWFPNNFYANAQIPPGQGEFGLEGYGHEGYGHEGYGHRGYGHGGYGHEGYGHQGYGHEGYGHERHGREGHSDERHGREGHKQEKRGHDGHGHEGHGKEGHGREGHGREGHGPEGHGHEGHGREGHGGEEHKQRKGKGGKNKNREGQVYQYNAAWANQENPFESYDKPKVHRKKNEKHAKPHKPRARHYEDFYNIYNNLEADFKIDDPQAVPNMTELESINDDFDGRSVVAPGEYPHMAAIGYPAFEDKIEFKCGGSLISFEYVLTAAHCCSLNGDQPVLAQFGIINLVDENVYNVLPQQRLILEVLVHPMYKATIHYYDIALLKLQEPVERTPFVKPIRLWALDTVPYESVFTMGYGSTSFAKASTHILTEMELSVVPQNECNIELLPSESTPQGVTETQICAKDYVLHRDTCQGDSGGPLQLNLQRRRRPGFKFYLVGIISYGEVCGGGTPGVYTKISSYTDWIASIVWPQEFQNF